MIKITIVSLMIALLTILSLHSLNTDRLTDALIKAYSDDSLETDLLPIYIVLEKQYKPGLLYKEVQGLGKTDRRERTVTTLKRFSDETQKSIRSSIYELEKNGEVDRVSYFWIVNVIGMNAGREAISQLSEHPDVKLIDYDPKTLLIPEDMSEIEGWELNSSDYSPQEKSRNDGTRQPDIAWHIEHVNASDVWDSGYRGEDVLVAILDTGVNYMHNDIANRMWQHPDFPYHGYNFVDDNLNTFDGHGHGTYCAGIVAGEGVSGLITGVAPASIIMDVKVMDDIGRGRFQDIWNGMQFSVEYGADVLSMSIGALRTGQEIRAINRSIAENVLSAGLLISVAAGNAGNSQTRFPIPYNISTPADCPPPYLHSDQTLIGGISSVIAVGATDQDDEIADFSSRGPVTWQDVPDYWDYPYEPEMGLIKPDLCAPGYGIISLHSNYHSSYGISGGTSAAAPIVAGVIALMLSKNPLLTPEEIARLIDETVKPLSEYKSNTYGSGRVDAKGAFDLCPHIRLTEVVFVDDNNNIPEYGELVNLTVKLEHSHQTGTVTGILSSEDEFVQIVDNFCVFDFAVADSLLIMNEAYTVRISDDIPDGHEVNFNLTIGYEETVLMSSNFSMRVSAPHLTTSFAYFTDSSPGGNNNGLIEPGEEIVVYLPIANRGGSNSPPVDVSVVSNNPLAIITNLSESSYNTIQSGDTKYPYINVSISEDIGFQEQLSFLYLYETGSYIFSDEVVLNMGEIFQARLGSGDKDSANNQPSPINIYFQSLRSQTVYNVQELNRAGLMGALPINQLGYYVTEAPEYPLPGFLIRIKHTAAEDAGEHDEGPFENSVYFENFIPEAGRWNMFTLTPPFQWNGTDNILIDTVFSPLPEWSRTGKVKIYDAEDEFRYLRTDYLDLKDIPTTHTTDYKPQLAIVFNQDEDAVTYRPTNLKARLIDMEVSLDWQAPDTDSTANGRRGLNRLRDNRMRSPDLLGYNIYRNGIRINEEPVDTTGFVVDDIELTKRYYYYITSVLSDRESLPSNTVGFQSQVTAPLFSHESGEYESGISVSLISTPSDATIYYTLDNNSPDETSSQFDPDVPIDINETTTVKAIAYREGMLPSDISTETFIILDLQEEETPVYETRLYQAYPNPFNPDTNIAFGLSQDQQVSLKIYNIRGQLVRTLLDNEHLERGRHNLIWDGQDESGRISGSGVYFYRLTGESESFTRKMVMIK